ncbi:MAG: RraA family protein [Spirochaetaceae bacterium]|jgi:regulator of RNase E activity RraA|nr:RraA family protein [Spirochaetaceae bacterium]
MAVDAEILERCKKVDPATIGHFISGGFMHPRMKPLNRSCRVIGPALTVRIPGKDSGALYHALKHGEPGSVVVVDRCGDGVYACVGELVAYCAEKRGFAGMVIDGPVTDSAVLERSSFPVFATGISVVTTVVYGITGDWGKPVQCAGAAVRPGDIVFGDADGVVVIDPADLERVLLRAEAALEREKTIRSYIDGHGFFPMDIDKLMEARVPDMIDAIKRKT